jgi:unsaturated chondroitin disaccharide hydrolase
VYQLTHDRQFLETAVRCADYFLARLPPGMVPYWDFDLPKGPDRIWDSSAAAIAASGLLQLGDLTDDASRSAKYRTAALDILDALCSDQFLAASTPGWEGILLHAVYHFHKKLGVDESVMWGDHFFVEALCRAMKSPEAT